MKIAVIGAGGFIGKRLVRKLLLNKKYSVVAISLHPEKLYSIRCKRLEIIKCDIFDTQKLTKAISDCNMAFYLVHMMAKDFSNFPALESKAAKSFCDAANSAKVKKVIYLGGLGDDNFRLSKHLKSRHKTGKILARQISKVYEFRASIIIGDGSTSFEMIKSIVNKMPLLVLPGWANTLLQPICSKDTVAYLIDAINLNLDGHQIFEIGGPKMMTYKELLVRYAHFKKKKLLVVIIKWLPRWPAKLWLKMFIDKQLYSVGISMIESLEYDVVVKNNRASLCFDKISPKEIESEFS